MLAPPHTLKHSAAARPDCTAQAAMGKAQRTPNLLATCLCPC